MFSLHPSLYFFLKSFFHLFLMSTLVPDENSMKDPLCNSSFGSMVSLDYVTPDTFKPLLSNPFFQTPSFKHRLSNPVFQTPSFKPRLSNPVFQTPSFKPRLSNPVFQILSIFSFFVGGSKSDFFWASLSLRFLLTALMSKFNFWARLGRYPFEPFFLFFLLFFLFFFFSCFFSSPRI